MAAQAERSILMDGPRPGEPGAGRGPSCPWVDLSPRNPLRPLDWRWRLASIGEDVRGRPRWLRCDPWTRRARRIIFRHQGGHRRPGARDRPLVAADALRYSALKAEVELRLLAGQDDATIASRCGLEAGTVAAYAALFYDVRSLIEHPDALLFAAVGPRLCDADGGGIEVTLKLLAIHGGTHVVDALLGGGEAGADVDPKIEEAVRLLVEVRALDADGPDAAILLRLFARQVGVDRDGLRDRVGVATAPIEFGQPDLSKILSRAQPGSGRPEDVSSGRKDSFAEIPCHALPGEDYGPFRSTG